MAGTGTKPTNQIGEVVFCAWVRAAILELGAEYRKLLDEETKQQPATVVNTLPCVLRGLSPEERTEFLRRATNSEEEL